MPFSAAGAIIGAGAAIYGATQSSNAASDAANAQVSAATQAAQTQQNMFNTTQANLSPWMTAGQAGLSTLEQLLGLTNGSTTTPAPAAAPPAAAPQGTTGFAQAGWTPSSPLPPGIVPTSGGGYWDLGTGQPTTLPLSQPQPQAPAPAQPGVPGPANPSAATIAAGGVGSLTAPFAYQGPTPGAAWGLSQGLNATTNAASTSGLGGNALTALTNYGLNSGMSDYWNQYNAYTGRQNQIYSMFSGLSGSGQNAAASLGGFGQNAANAIGSAQIGAGNATAAGIIGGANASNAGFGNAANYLFSPSVTNSLSGLFSGGGGASTSGWNIPLAFQDGSI